MACTSFLNFRVLGMSGYSNAGVLAAVALAVVALLWPAVLACPYQLIILCQLWRWSLGRESSSVSNTACHALQTYCGVQFFHLWLVQHI